MAETSTFKIMPKQRGLARSLGSGIDLKHQHSMIFYFSRPLWGRGRRSEERLVTSAVHPKGDIFPLRLRCPPIADILHSPNNSVRFCICRSDFCVADVGAVPSTEDNFHLMPHAQPKHIALCIRTGSSIHRDQSSTIKSILADQVRGDFVGIVNFGDVWEHETKTLLTKKQILHTHYDNGGDPDYGYDAAPSTFRQFGNKADWLAD